MGGEHLYGKERLKREKNKEKRRQAEKAVKGKQYLQGGNLQKGQTERRMKQENKEKGRSSMGRMERENK